MTLTDFITLFFSIYLLLRGASRGFMNSLLGPFSVIVATVISIVYYQCTKDVMVSLVIGLIGPMVLHFFLKLVLKAFGKATDTDIKPNPLSRMTGALLTLSWGWVFVIFTLILLAVLPPLGDQLTAMHQDVTRSMSYSIAKPVEDIFFAPSKKEIAAANASPAVEATSLAQDPRFQRILQDPDIQKEINARDFAKLMSNPKIMDLTQQLLSDPAMLQKVMSVYKNSTAALAQTGKASQ